MDDIVWPPRKLAGPRHVAPPQVEPTVDTDSEPDEPIQDMPPIPDEPQTENTPEAPIEPTEPEAPAQDEPKPPSDHKQLSPKKKDRWRIRFHHVHMSKKKWALLIAVLLILIGGGVVGASTLYAHYSKPVPQAAQPKTVKKVVPPKPTTEASRLTGVQISPAENLRPVTGIMIENSPDARPQSGLKDAGVVYEAIAEGGITRFLALFQEARPDYIGPVRSVRPYYLDFLMPYDAAIAHVGGAPQALSDIKTLGIKDLDQFYNADGYWRISQRYAPHNVYTSFDKMDALNASKGFNTSTFTGFVRKDDKPAKTPAVKTTPTTTPVPVIKDIDVAISGPLYDVHYTYNATTKSYDRFEGGKSHVDDKSNIQLSPKVVVALVMTRGIAGDGQHTDYGTTGTGHMFVFQDGEVTEGTWAKAGRKDQFAFTDSAGAVLKLNPGQTWVTIVDASTDVTYK